MDALRLSLLAMPNALLVVMCVDLAQDTVAPVAADSATRIMQTLVVSIISVVVAM